MRLSIILTIAYSAFALATPSVISEKRAADPQPAAVPGAAPLDPALHALITRSLEERQGLLDISQTLADIGPTIKALGDLLNSQTLGEIKSIVSHAAVLLDDEGTTAAKGVLVQANRLLTPENTDTLVALFNDVGPILRQLSPLFTQLSAVLQGLSNFFGL